MSNAYRVDFYVVAASLGGITEEWVAATTPKEALVAVQLQAGPQWEVKLTDQRLAATEGARLKIRVGDVLRLSRVVDQNP